LSPVKVPGRAVAFKERLDGRYEQYDAIRIEVVATRGFGSEVHGQPV